jgi:lambda family phage tail tape measure protein
MAEEITRLSLQVDSTQVASANSELDKFATQGKKAETAATAFERAGKGASSAMAGIANTAGQANSAQAGLAQNARASAASLEASSSAALRVQTAQAALAVATARVTVAQEAFNRAQAAGPATQTQFALASARVEQAQASQAQAAARLAAAQALLTVSTKSAGAAAAITAQQQQQLGFQLHDFFVQVAAGQNPLTAFVQQGSQLSGAFGSAGNALRAVAGIFTATRLLLGGLAGATIGVAVAFHQGSEESLAFQRAIILTGNAAGVTEGQFNDMARTIADSTKTTIGSARETLQSLVASGRFSGDALAQAARGVQLLSKVTGQSRDEIIKDFVRAADGPTRFAEQTNRSLNFLTAKQIDYIRTLEDQGRTQEALAVTFAALNERTGEAAEKVGTLERAWLAVKRAVSGAADALLSIGRDQTAEEAIRGLRAELELLAQQQSPEEQGSGAVDRRRAEIEDLIRSLERQQSAERSTAAAAAQAAQTNQAAIAFGKLKEQTLTRQARLAKELADANALADRAGATAAERAAVLAGIREKFASLDSDVNAIARAKLQADLEAIEQVLKDRNDAVRNAQTVFNALRQAGRLNDEEAFAAQRAQVALQAQFEVQALQDQIARLQQQRFIGKDAARLAIENAKQIASAQSQIARVRSAAAAADDALTIQQEANARRRIAAQQQEQISAVQAFEAVRRAHELELALAGSGDVERSRAQARAQIEDKFRADIERATNEIQSKRTAGTATADDEREFDARLALLREFLSRSLAEYDQFFLKRKQQEGDATIGASEAFRKYQEQAANAAKLSENFFTRSLERLEDALVEFVTKGKFNWRSLADSIVAEITRVIIKQQIANLLGDSTKGGDGFGAFAQFLAGAFGGGRAQGGTVTRGNLYRINEEAGPGEILNAGGRQYLLAAQNGRIEPQQKGGDNVVNQSFNVNVQGNPTRDSADQFAARAATKLRRASARLN